MKVRVDFVTNSSSSSFICDICNHEESGFNSHFDLGFAECYNNHWICFDCIEKDYPLDFIKQEIIKDLNLSDKLKKKVESCESLQDIVYIDELNLEYIPTSICSICNFKKIATYDLERYKNYLLGKSNEDLRKEIKDKFNSFNDFVSTIRKGE